MPQRRLSLLFPSVKLLLPTVSGSFVIAQAAQDEADLVEEQLRAERLKAQAAQRELSNVVARLETVRPSCLLYL